MKVKKLISIILCLCLVTGCLSIASFNAYADDTVYTSQDGLWKYRVLADGTAEIYNSGDCAYLGNAAELVVPDGIDGHTVVALTSFSLSSLDSVQSVSIGANISRIEPTSIANCPQLTVINVDSDNESFCSFEGVLYNRNKTQLLSYPTAKPDTSFSIPEGVESVAFDAFLFCSCLESVTFPDSLKSIGGEAFAACFSLNNVVIPDNVESLGMYAFYMCESLSNVSLSESLTQLQPCTFGACTALTEITIPSGISTIDASAFEDSAVTTIIGYYDTEAESFAETKGFTFVSLDVIIPGDANADGVTNLSDYTTVEQYISGQTDKLTKVQRLSADLSPDGAVDAFDLFELDKMLHSI
ncbi:MAG: leucine-rich repeat protein [Clostridiaceae bacterium]|nr:leucine-rich repeat protein [Clostridiaceae bacterium]